MHTPRNFSDILSDLNINLFATVLTNTEYGFENWYIDSTLYRPIPCVAGEFYGYSEEQIEAYLGPLYEFHGLGTFRCIDRESPNWAPGTDTIWVKSGGNLFLFVRSFLRGWKLAVNPVWPEDVGPVDVNDLFDVIPADFQTQASNLSLLASRFPDNPDLAKRVFRLSQAIGKKLVPLVENTSSRYNGWGVKQFQDLLNRVPLGESVSGLFKPQQVKVPWNHLI